MEKKPFKGRSLLSFFGWNGKSQKKLFVDVANQAKENIETMPISQVKYSQHFQPFLVFPSFFSYPFFLFFLLYYVIVTNVLDKDG